MRFHFGQYCFDADRRELSAQGSRIHLTPKAVELLRLLIAERPRMIRKEEIYERIWPDTHVEEANLSVHISELRSALQDDSKEPRFIKTAHRFGYGFIADARSDGMSMIRLRSGRREYPLLDGENIVGRDTAAAIRLNAPGISRRHARIHVSGSSVTIEDLGSKNGTYVQGVRVGGVQELRDGDEIRVSRELLVVLKTPPGASTVTDAG
jgi:DNA-binding winged helix-turn-helix (wHTH) protein